MPNASKKGKNSQDPIDCPIPSGMWGPTFNLGHKIDFNLDDAEKKVVEGMTENQMADIAMELTCQMAMAT